MKKIAVGTVKNFIKESSDDRKFTLSYPVEDSAFDVEVKTRLTVIERSMFINRVVSGCFGLDGVLMPEYFEPLFRVTVLQMATNLPVISLKAEEGDEEKYVDIDAMNELWCALDAENKFYENNAFCDFFSSLHFECDAAIKRAVEEKRLEKILNKLDGFEIIGDTIKSARDMLESVNELFGNDDIANTLKDYIVMQGEISEIKS